MEQFNEIIHEAMMMGISVSMEPASYPPKTYRITFRKDSCFTCTHVSWNMVNQAVSDEFECYILKEAIQDLLNRCLEEDRRRLAVKYNRPNLTIMDKVVKGET